MTTLRCNVKPYEGTEPFVFFSFAPRDKGLAYPMLERLNRHGVRAWYDDGALPADRRGAVLAARLQSSSVCVFLQTEQASAHHFCRVAAMNAYEMKKGMLLLRYDGDDMTLGMERLFAAAPALECPALPDEAFEAALCGHPLLQKCLGAEVEVLSVQEYHLDWEEPRIPTGQFDEAEKSVPGARPVPSVKPEPVKQPEPVAKTEPVKKAEPPKKPPQPVLPAEEEDPLDKTIPDDGLLDALDATIPDTPLTPPAVVHLTTGRVFSLLPGENTLGRGTDCRIRVGSKSVSRSHACLMLLGGVCSLREMNAVNGTSLNGERLERGATVTLEGDAEIRLAQETLFLVLPPRSEKLRRAQRLIALQSVKTAQTRYLFEGSMLLGRSAAWEGGAMKARNISHRHAQLEVTAEGCTITDLDSVNGTYVNNQRIPAREPFALTPGDRIMLGDESFIYDCFPLQKEELV